MTRASFAWALCATLAACVKSTSLQKFVELDPIFDSVFVGNLKPLPSVIYFDGDKLQTPPASAVTWQSSDPTILAVNNPSGQIKGLKRGTAFVSATVENTQGSEIVTVPDSVDITLLVDTLYLLPGGSAFRIQATHAETATSSEQVVQVTVNAAASLGTGFEIDSITPADSSTCNPPQAWAIWSTPAITAYSVKPDVIQQVSITQLVTITGGGKVAGGRFSYRARRGDATYTFPFGLVRITGVFVAPLTAASLCP